MSILQQTSQKINTVALIAADPKVMQVKTYDRRGEWFVEIICKGEAKVTVKADDVDEVNALEIELSERGWRIVPSLWTNGFNASRLGVAVEAEIPANGQPYPLDEPLGYNEDDELIFVSGLEMWPDDYSLELPL